MRARVSDSKARAAAVKIAAEVTRVGGGGATVHMRRRRFVPRCRGSPVARTGNAAATSKYGPYRPGPAARLACIYIYNTGGDEITSVPTCTHAIVCARAHTPPVALLLSCTGATSAAVGRTRRAGDGGGGPTGATGGRARLRGARHCWCTAAAAGKTNICPSGPCLPPRYGPSAEWGAEA